MKSSKRNKRNYEYSYHNFNKWKSISLSFHTYFLKKIYLNKSAPILIILYILGNFEKYIGHFLTKKSMNSYAKLVCTIWFFLSLNNKMNACMIWNTKLTQKNILSKKILRRIIFSWVFSTLIYYHIGSFKLYKKISQSK